MILFVPSRKFPRRLGCAMERTQMTDHLWERYSARSLGLEQKWAMLHNLHMGYHLVRVTIKSSFPYHDFMIQLTQKTS